MNEASKETEQPNRNDRHFSKLFDGDAIRIAKAHGVKAVATFASVIIHADKATKQCWPSLTRIGKHCHLRDRHAIAAKLGALATTGDIDRKRRRRKSSLLTVACSDVGPGHTQISQRWLEEHAILGASALGLLLTLCALAKGRPLEMKLNDVLLAVNLSRASLYRLAKKLADAGWIRWRCKDGVMECSVSKTALLGISKAAIQESQNPTGTRQDLRTRQVLELDEVKRKEEEESTQDVASRPEKRSTPSFEPESQSQKQKPKPANVSEPAEPPTHDNCECIDGILLTVDVDGHTRGKQCQRSIAWRKWMDAEQKAAEQAERSRPSSHYLSFDFSDMLIKRPSAQALPPALPPPRTPPTIEGQWSDARIAGQVMSAALFKDCWIRIAVETGNDDDNWDEDTRKRVNGMLRKGGVALVGAKRFQEAMRDVLHEKWERKHGHCHDACTCGCELCECYFTCDGSCGHDPDECDGMPQYIDDDKAMLDLVGRALAKIATGENMFGTEEENFTNCPKAVYAATHGG